MGYADIETWNKIKQMEFLRKGGSHWMIDFTEALEELKYKEKYNEVWQKIKKKNNW